MGANRGEFSRALCERFGARCVAVEASPAIAAKISPSENLRVFNYAITDRDGPVTFNVADNSEMSSIHAANAGPDSRISSVQVPGRTIATFLSENGIDRVDLLKVDIEGAEVQLFGPSTSDQTLAKVAQITIEFHDFTGVISKADVDAIVRRLKSAGFVPVRFSHTNMDWLFARPERCGLGLISTAWIKWIVRNWRFFRRNLLGAPRD